MILSCKNLVPNIHDTPLFAPITFEMKTGEILWLRGKNGIGKTSLLRTLAGLKKDFDGALSPAESLCFMTSDLPMDPELSVLEALEFWAEFYDSDYKKWIHDLQLEPLCFQHIKDLSSGQKQKLNFTRLLISKAHLWLLDEPFAHLDPKTEQLLSSEIQKHCQQDGSVIITSHKPLIFMEPTQEIILSSKKTDWSLECA